MGPPATHTTPIFESLGLYGKGGPMSLGVPEKNPYPIVEKLLFFLLQKIPFCLVPTTPQTSWDPLAHLLVSFAHHFYAQPSHMYSNSSRCANRNWGEAPNEPRKKGPLLLSMKYWVVNRDPYI